MNLGLSGFNETKIQPIPKVKMFKTIPKMCFSLFQEEIKSLQGPYPNVHRYFCRANLFLCSLAFNAHKKWTFRYSETQFSIV